MLVEKEKKVKRGSQSGEKGGRYLYIKAAEGRVMTLDHIWISITLASSDRGCIETVLTELLLKVDL
jgi:hypothetical protein